MQAYDLNKIHEEVLYNIVDYINVHYDVTFRAPSVNAVAIQFNLSADTAYKFLVELRDRGDIFFDGYDGTIITPHMRTVGYNNIVILDIKGSINCGRPVSETEEHRGSFLLPRSFLGCGTFYALVACGDSMTGKGIDDGDLIVIKRTSCAEAGDIVVALNEDNENTLKTLKFDDQLQRYYLHAENDKYDDIYPEVLNVTGVAVKIVKSIK